MNAEQFIQEMVAGDIDVAERDDHVITTIVLGLATLAQLIDEQHTIIANLRDQVRRLEQDTDNGPPAIRLEEYHTPVDEGDTP